MTLRDDSQIDKPGMEINNVKRFRSIYEVLLQLAFLANPISH